MKNNLRRPKNLKIYEKINQIVGAAIMLLADASWIQLLL